ncbi:ribosomal protein S18-alanine N-acetyltransferase [uncultured Psychrobacter sp.]|uniref:ribosomal protein S18-alanine N-acetyltransferase n=1 Tax=uncultured Psychrobacter sp. TaxID=259303 RepID=UPI00345870C5
MLSTQRIRTINDESINVIKDVAGIEASIQPQDAWAYNTIKDMLSQEGVELLIVIECTQEEKQRVVGYCLYQLLFEQAEILRIGTHPCYQRRGVASQLFFEINKELQSKEVMSLLLEVREDNTPAIALYKQQGFAIIHRRHNYYQTLHQPSIDALVMELSYIVNPK